MATIDLATILGGSLLVAGDYGRVTVTALASDTETTILNLTTTAGIFQGIWITNFTGDTSLTSVKLTIDGASERTLFSGAGAISITGAGQNCAIFIPTPLIAFSSSLTVKVQLNDAGGGAVASAIYTITP